MTLNRNQAGPAEEFSTAMPSSRTKTRTFDFIFAAVVFAIGFAWYGNLYLRHEDRFLFYQKYFFSAVNLYCLTDPDAREINSHTQELSERINLAIISCEDIARSPKVQPSQYNGWHDTHPIMSTMIALLWKHYEFSWKALWPMAGLLGGLTILSFYVVLRCFSVPLPAAILLLPAMIPYPFAEQNFYYLRDFSKTPFLILSFALTGPLFRPSTTIKGRLSLLAGATLLVVVGSGFRQDTIVMLPVIVAAAALTLAPIDRSGVLQLVQELVAVLIVYLAATQVLGILKTSQPMQLQGYPHFVIQGFGDPFLSEARSLVPGISFLTLYSDMLAWALVDANTPAKVRYFVYFDDNYTSSGFNLIFKYVTLSAADVVTRVFLALGATTRDYWLVPESGTWLLLLLGLTSLGKWRLGLFFTFTILSLCAAGSLQFSPRHLLHLIMLDRVFLVIIGTAYVAAAWQFAVCGLRLRMGLAVGLAAAGSATLVLLIVGAQVIQQRSLLALEARLATTHWFASEAAYSEAFPGRTESLLRISIGGQDCPVSKAEAIITNEGQKISRSIDLTLGNPRPVYFALLEPRIDEIKVDVAPRECIVSRAWGPLGDGKITPLQFFDPATAVQTNTLQRHLSRIWSSFL